MHFRFRCYRTPFSKGEPMGSRMFYGYFPNKDIVIIIIAVDSAAEPTVPARH